ncbi:type II secretion system F family protein [Candidatus Magnetominusculus xianensis]|uniref:General secretion pathway protein GspF n=1 Tax=Candidatus Magnetominusculus xianensis TaxID=1748249 RepID=A0ABR5SES7_9BACT|nr:type II secretion system F family protein [Candidatus Magnetominusculus xianensis]KWT75621.1 general secretion pathway protein GspF [Candidatus Magnetominusculus xianensis]MBF0403704.1 type II secretion system F family protein [Nitrospirota bacterium]
MPIFNYKAVDSLGATVAGTIDAAALDIAEDMLYSSGLIPLKVYQPKGFSVRGFSAFSFKTSTRQVGRVSPPDLIMFLKQFRTMYRAGIPLMRLLEIMKTQTENRALKDISGNMMADISDGLALSEAMGKYPSVFLPLYCSMIKAGEASGNVPEVMDRLIYIISHETKVKSEIKSAMTYPIIVVIALLGAFIFLLTFVIPKFVAIFAKYEITLPLPTRIAIVMHDGLSHYWAIFLLSAIGLVFFLYTYFKTDNGKFVRDSFLLSIPVFGPLFVKASMSRFASIFSILHASGVPLLESLTILAETFGNAAISRIFKALREKIEEGKGISSPLGDAKYFTPMVVTMVSIGEETGNLDEMLNEISIHYDDEVRYTISRLTELIGPFLIVCLAVVVLFFALAIFLPMWDLTKVANRS